MTVAIERVRLSHQARARIADNLLVARRRAGLSQVALEEISKVTSGRISEIENGRVVGMLDSYVRLAGALGVTLDDLLAGVRWTAGTLESESEAAYAVDSELRGIRR
jgi:transcriptional regulator with XRE-family HTH domain